MNLNYQALFSCSCIGAMSHSRWTTTANCICRLYISTPEPDDILKWLVQYILRIYAPISLEIKRHPSCVMGARHYHSLIESSRFLIELLPPSVMEKLDKCIHRNAFYAHPENVLLAMCDDDRQPIRALAYRRILDARKSLQEIPPDDVCLRSFHH